MTFSELMDATHSCQNVALLLKTDELCGRNTIVGEAEILKNFVCSDVCDAEVEEISAKDGALKVLVKL